MSEVDVGRVSALLHIAEACTGHSGRLSNLQGWAIAELIAINGEIKTEAAAQAKAEAEQVQIVEDRDEGPAVDPDLGAPRAIPQRRV